MKVEAEFAGLCKEFTKAGKVRWRVRRAGQKGKKMTIPVGPGHADFHAHYEAARLGKKAELKAPDKPSRGKLDELRERYCEAMAALVATGKMSELTRSGRTRGLLQACDIKKNGVRMGSLAAAMPKPAFVYILDQFGARTGAAETCLKALKAAYKWGEDRGFPVDSPVLRVTSPHKSMGGATAWNVDDEKTFLEKHGPGTMARRWFYLARNTAGRIGDMNKLGVHNIVSEGGRAFLTWQPGKKGPKPVTVPIMDELADELANDTGEEATFLRTESGRPFASSGSLDNKVRDWIVAAKLTGADGKAVRSQHGIRKATAHELAKAGASVFEVAARLSHSDVKSSAPYVADVERAGLVLSGFERVEKARKAAGVPQPQKRGTLPEGTSMKTKFSVGKWQPVGESNPSFQVENLTS